MTINSEKDRARQAFALPPQTDRAMLKCGELRSRAHARIVAVVIAIIVAVVVPQTAYSLGFS